LHSVGVTLTAGGEVFYEAASVLPAFVLLGHWFEMRPRRGERRGPHAPRARTPMAVALRDGEAVEISTAEVVVGDLLLIRPGEKVPVDGVVENRISEVDESMVTGESLPVGKTPGADVLGASIKHHRNAAGPRHQGWVRHRARPDRGDGPGRAEVDGPRSTAHRPGGVPRYLDGCRLDRPTAAAGGPQRSRGRRDLGFHDQAHVTRHFRRLLGTTPAAYARSAA
jgi:magnesium-transporting ATPase (P-type)